MWQPSLPHPHFLTVEAVWPSVSSTYRQDCPIGSIMMDWTLKLWVKISPLSLSKTESSEHTYRLGLS